jgi:hypothetical protein
MKSTIVLTFCMLFFVITEQAEAGYTGSNDFVIVASDNAWVNMDFPDSDQSENDVIYAKYNDRQAFVRFDISQLIGQTNIISATLSIYQTTCDDANGSHAIQLYALTDGTAETNWTSVMTWNNRPTSTTGVQATKTAAANTLHNFDLTSKLPGLLAGDTNGKLSFVFRAPYSPKLLSWAFSSLNNTGSYPKPTLTVVAIFPPPKGTIIRFR